VRISNGFLDLPRPGTAAPGDAASAGRARSDGPVATIGNFDAAHLGHRRIFERVLERANTLGAPAVAITFDPHPMKILRPAVAPRMILTRLQKIEILQEAGFDGAIFIPFDAAIAEIEAERFVREFLVGRVGIREIYTGVDFRFGRGRLGNPELLHRMGAELGYRFESVPIVELDGVRISASRIREALAAGDVEGARAMMGRPYEAIGDVVHGAGRGRTQGAPTANIEVANEMLPRGGVYVTEARLDRAAGHPSLTNIGTRPTFENAGFAFETWLPDFKGDLYGRRLRVRFLARVRDEMKFPNAEALRDQIERDLAVMRDHFRKSGGQP
jgi:riboflavin kinase/FMN adenylyltransferase